MAYRLKMTSSYQTAASCPPKSERKTSLIKHIRILRGSLNKDLRELESLYEKDWSSIASDKRIDEKDEQALAAAAKKGRYSVLGQDTIWNALQDAYQLQMALTKLLVKNLKG